MADEAILPTTYVYGPHLLAQGQFPIGFRGQTPVTVAGLPIQLNTAFSSNQTANSPTVFVAGGKLHQTQGQDEAGTGVPSPVNSTGEWRPTTAQKRQRTESASDVVLQPTTPTTHTPTTNQVYDWNNPAAPHTPTQSTATPLTPKSAQPMILPTTLMSPLQQHNIQMTQVASPRTGSTPATPTTGNAPLTIPGEMVWPGMGRTIMMTDTQGSQQSLDFSDGGSEDSSDSPHSKLGAGEWPQNPNGTINSSLPQTPTSTTEGSDPNTPGANDAEGVWSPDIEHAFQEALAIYPPCGRRKIILSDEGKMYGRNELIARYIKLRTGKSRSRKQVSSHIQVLAKKKAREIQGKIKDPVAKDKAMANLSSMSSAQIVSASSIHSRPSVNVFPTPGIAPNAMPMGQMFTSSPVNPITIKQEPTAGLMWHPGGPTLVQQSHALPAHFQSLAAGGMIPIAFHPSAIGQPAIPTVSSGAESAKTTITSPVQTNQSQSPVTVPNHTQEANPTASTQLVTPELPLKLVDFCAFVESQANQQDTPQKHVFAHISDANFNDQDLETIDITHIWDKFPQKNGGLKDLYEKGPHNSFFLVKFWGSVTTPLIEEPDCFYGVSSRFEGSENKTITCSTKVCSFGTQVVEKVETEYAKFENAKFVYRINRSPMCEYMLNFIQRLYHLPESYMMNNVLEQFTILQVVSDRDTQETLLCLAYLFEVNSDESNKFSLYRLVKSN